MLIWTADYYFEEATLSLVSPMIRSSFNEDRLNRFSNDALSQLEDDAKVREIRINDSKLKPRTLCGKMKIYHKLEAGFHSMTKVEKFMLVYCKEYSVITKPKKT